MPPELALLDERKATVTLTDAELELIKSIKEGQQELRKEANERFNTVDKKFGTIHTPADCVKAADLNKEVKLLQKQVYIWAGGLGALVFVFGVIVTFVR